MSKVFDGLIKKLKEKATVDINDESCVSFSGVGLTNTLFISGEKFRKIYTEYIDAKVNEGLNSISDQRNTLQVHKAYNALYLDIDFKFKYDIQKKKMMDTCKEMCEDYMEKWIQQLEKYDVRFYRFGFIPETYPNQKGGAHAMIFCDVNISKEDRMKMYNDIKFEMCQIMCQKYMEFIQMETTKDSKSKTLRPHKSGIGPGLNVTSKSQSSDLNDTEIENYVINHYNQIFDVGPLKSCSCLLPFAHKLPESRNYVLIYESFTSAETYPYFVLPSVHIQNENDEHVEFGPNHLLSDDSDFQEKNEEEEEHGEFSHVLPENEELEMVLTGGIYDDLGIAGAIVYQFLASLRNLSYNHKFWRLLHNFDSRSKVICPIISIFKLCQFHHKRGKITHEATKIIKKYVLKIIKPLEKIAYHITTDEHDNDIEVHMEKINNFIDFILKTNDAEKFNVDFGCWMKYLSLDSAQKNILKSIGKVKLKQKKQPVITPEEQTKDKKKAKKNKGKKSEPEQKPEEKYFYSHQVDGLFRMFRKWWESWFRFVNLILDDISNELEPFIETKKTEDPRIHPKLQKVKLEDGTEIEVERRIQYLDFHQYNSINRRYYDDVLKIWFNMFLFVKLQSTRRMQEALRVTLIEFVKKYIYRETGVDDKSTVLYIYNIQQVHSLWSYPYNQWIKDGKSGHLIAWFNHLYSDYISHNLTTEKLLEQTYPLMGLLRETEILAFSKNELNIYTNYRTELKKMCDDVVLSSTNNYVQPNLLSSTNSAWFPMHNGLLEFDSKTGEVTFHTDNHERYMEVTSNIIWEDNYNSDNKYFHRVKQFWESVYPDDEVREYVLLILSSVLHGLSLKDQFVILYGDGGDGKTTVCAAIKGLLGYGNINNTAKIVDLTTGKKRKETFKNVCGMASTMRSEIILIGQKSTHGEGGDIELLNRRFCDMQEPSQKDSKGEIDVSVVKNMIGAGSINSRHIFAESQKFTPNCLIVLQTNSVLNYSETGTATNRRFTIIPHEVKFVTQNIQDQCKNGNHQKANPNYINKFLTHPMWQQAVFYVLLPYAKRLIVKLRNSKESSLSNIPRPEKIETVTLDSFKSGNIVSRMFGDNYRKMDGHVVGFREIMTRFQAIQKGSKANYSAFMGRTESEKDKWLAEQMFNTMNGLIYELKPSFITKKKSTGKNQVSIPNFPTNKTNEQLIEMFFKRHPISNYTLVSDNKWLDLFIVGYCDVKDLDEDEDTEEFHRD